MRFFIVYLFLFFMIVSLIGWKIYLSLRFSGSQSTSPTSPSIFNPPPRATRPPRTPLLVKASIPYWDQQLALRSFQDHVEQIDIVSLFWYYLTEDGAIHKYRYAQEDASIMAFAHGEGVQVTAVITNLPEEEGSSWDSERVERMLNNSQARSRHIREIAEKLKSLNFDGVTIDYEGVVGSQRENFTLFIEELVTVLRPMNKIVGVTLHPKTGKEADQRYAFQDWSALSSEADHLYIMAYGEHWDGGEPGPIASIGWVQSIITYAQSLRIPEELIFLGIPLYGYDWKEGGDTAEGLTHSEVQHILGRYSTEMEWNSEAKSPHFHYEQGGRKHEVWFENARSVGEKIRLAEEAGFAGIAFWRLGGEDSEIWEKVAH